MLPGEASGGSGIGAALGKVAAKVSKPKSVGRSVGRAVARSSSPRSRTSGGSSRSSLSGSSRSSGGGGYKASSGGGGGGSSLGSAAAKIVAPPSINSYLGTDSVYQQALSGGKRSLADFLSDLNRRRGESTTQFNMTTSNMDRDRTQQLESLRDEYASRGLLNSGVYGDQVGNFEKQFTDQRNSLAQQQASLIADLLSQETNYRRENDLATQAAKQEALARRAAKYNIGG